MIPDPQASATKQDVSMIMEQFGLLIVKVENLENSVDEKIMASEERMMLKMEQLHCDVLDVTRDQIGGLKTRIARLEQRAGLL